MRHGPLLYCVCGAMLSNETREIEPGVRAYSLPKCHCGNDRVFRHVDKPFWKLTAWDRTLLAEMAVTPD